MHHRLGMLSVVGAAMLFGSTGTAQALGPAGTTPLGVGAMRILVGAAVLWLFAFRRPDLMRARTHLPALAVGAIGVAVYQPGFFVGTERSGVALGTIVALGSAPVFAGALQWGWLKRRPSPVWAAATTAMIIGGVILVLGRGGESVFSVVGTIGSLTAGFGYALFALTTKQLIDRGMNSTEALAWQFTIGALLLGALAGDPAPRMDLDRAGHGAGRASVSDCSGTDGSGWLWLSEAWRSPVGILTGPTSNPTRSPPSPVTIPPTVLDPA